MTVYEIQAARVASPIGTMRGEDRRDALDGILKGLYAIKGYTVADNVQPEIDEAVAKLDDKLTHRWPGMTFGEVNIALEAGCCGELGGTDRRLTIANYIGWLNAYVKSDERAEAMNKIIRHAAPAAAQIEDLSTAEKNDQACRRGAWELWDHFKRTGELGALSLGWPAAVYDWLREQGKLKPTEQTVEAARQQARGMRRRGISQALPDTEDCAVKAVLLWMYYNSLRSRGAELKV